MPKLAGMLLSDLEYEILSGRKVIRHYHTTEKAKELKREERKRIKLTGEKWDRYFFLRRLGESKKAEWSVLCFNIDEQCVGGGEISPYLFNRGVIRIVLQCKAESGQTSLFNMFFSRGHFRWVGPKTKSGLLTLTEFCYFLRDRFDNKELAYNVGSLMFKAMKKEGKLS